MFCLYHFQAKIHSVSLFWIRAFFRIFEALDYLEKKDFPIVCSEKSFSLVC